jgi:hypothetical protein
VIFSLTAKFTLIHFETPEIAKMLHNVNKGSGIGSFEKTFYRRFAVLALNVHGFPIDKNHIGFLKVSENDF